MSAAPFPTRPVSPGRARLQRRQWNLRFIQFANSTRLRGCQTLAFNEAYAPPLNRELLLVSETITKPDL